MKKPVSIGIVVYESCTSSMVTGMWDILSLANHAHKQEHGSSRFVLELIGKDRSPIQTFSGLTFTPQRTIASKQRYDLIYVPGFIGEADEVVERQKSVVQWLRRQQVGKTVFAAACNGNFILAASGVLDHKKATTHWSLTTKFQSAFHNVSLQPDRIIIDNGSVISAAGVTAYFNLGLHIIRRFADMKLALYCAKVFLVDAGRKIQTPYQVYHFSRSHGDDHIANVQEWLETNYKEKFSLDRLADSVQLTRKTFTRRFKKATGETPQLYLQKLRIENAKRLLESKDVTFNEVTWEVGYNDVSAFHKVFRQITGLTPMEYKKRFSML